MVPLTEKFTGAAPDFQATDDFFKTTLRSANVPATVSESARMSLKNADIAKNVPDGAAFGTVQGQLMALLKANPRMTYEELAERVGQTRKTVQRHLQQLKAKGLLRRIGGAKGGYWER